MLRNTRWYLLSAFVLLLGFAGGILFIASLGSAPRTSASPATANDAVPVVTAQGKELLSQFSAAFEAAAAKVNPSVVAITSEEVKKVENPFSGGQFRDFFGDDFFKRFFGNAPSEQTVRALGSGVVVSSDGYILTNNHVVKGAQKLTVELEDHRKFPAKVVGTDAQTDVAVIKIQAKDLPAASLGNSDGVRVGEWVIAVGNPFQLMHTVTAGIISAKGRSAVHLADYEDFIQTDASINPGNSGGALADLDGNVIGINTAILSPSGANAGIGLAIPVNMAKTVMRELISKGKVTRGYVGLYLQDVTGDLAKALKLKADEGSIVASVTPDGPADKAGVKQGDVITSFNGTKIKDTDQLRNLVAEAEPGTRATMEILRKGEQKSVEVTLGERPTEVASNAPVERERSTSKKLGLSLENLTSDLAQKYGYQNDHGVVISSVTPGSAADDAGLQAGDLVREIDQKDVRSVADVERMISDLKSGDTVALLVRRGDNTFFVALPIS